MKVKTSNSGKRNRGAAAPCPKLLVNITVYLCNNGIRFTKKVYPSALYFRLCCNLEENLLHSGSFSHDFILKDKPWLKLRQNAANFLQICKPT